jgi:hypothetical protein
MTTSGFKLIEVEENDIKRPRWALSIDDDGTKKLARRAWLELEVRLMSLGDSMSTRNMPLNVWPSLLI